MDNEQNQLPTPDISLQPADIPGDPPVTDDAGHATDEAQAAAPQQQPEPAAAPEDKGPQKFVDDKRNAIVARAREVRAESLSDFAGDVNDPALQYGTEAAADTDDMSPIEVEAMERARQVHQQPPAAAPKPLNGLAPEVLAREVPIVVNGQQSFITVEELIRREQQTRAADQKLNLAKQLLNQTQQYHRQQPQPGEGDGYDEQSGQDFPEMDAEIDAPRGKTSPAPQIDFADVTEKIQLGNPDEVAAALRNVFDAFQQDASQVDDATRVLTVLEDRNAKEALERFAERTPHIRDNPVLQAETTRHIHREMVNDLVSAGYSLDDLRTSVQNERALTDLHKQARISRMRGVRSTEQLIDAGYQGAVKSLRALADTIAQPRQANQPAQMQQRIQRKEQLQNQPAPRRMAPTLTQQQAPKTVDQSRSDAFSRMRQARGQTV